MTHPLVVVSVIAFLLVAGVAAMVLHDLRGRAVQRVQKSLHHLARQGEAILSLPESDIRRACLWGAQAREQVRALLSRAAADDFEHTISTLLAGAEMLDYYGRKRGGSDAARPRELDWVSSIRDGVAWLRRRTPLLAAARSAVRCAGCAPSRVNGGHRSTGKRIRLGPGGGGRENTEGKGPGGSKTVRVKKLLGNF